MTIKHLLPILYIIALLLPTQVVAQNMTREERIKALEKLKMEDAKWEQSAVAKISAEVPVEIEKLELPPLSVFLDAVTENATVQKAQSAIEQQKNAMRMEKRGWMKWIRGNGMYSFGRYNVLSNASDEYTPMYQTTMASNQQTFNVGVSVAITLDDIFNRPLRIKEHKYVIEQLQYTQQEVMEERSLRVLQAYNTVTEQLATIKATAESAALYNAQMKISE
ncbi:MAG: TolC family protein, partial [Prevotellaceae bacterium]|nr:TolC family protein [Prevotellaceae bacterium]